MIHYMKLNDEPFELIASGKKTVELRLYDEKRRKISENDIIVFSKRESEDLKIKAKVLRLHIFKDFKELYENLPLSKCGYTEKDIEKASYTDMYEYYEKEDIEKYGALGIEIALDEEAL